MLRRKTGGFLAAVLLVLICASFSITGPSLADDGTLEVQILSINDFHGSLTQTSNVSNRPAGGVAYLASYLLEREASNPLTLMVHAGDMVGGSPPISALFQDEPTLEVLQLLGFDVGVPGNHEFDEGVSELLRLQYGGRHQATGYWPGASFPLVLANVVSKDTGDPILPPYVIKTVGGIPIGFIGVVTTETPTIVMPTGVAGVEFLDPVESINKYVPELRAKGVEAIVVLAHEGGIQDSKTGEITGPIRTIAENIDDAVDVIISGHTHTYLNGEVDGKLVVQAYSKGTAFADVDLIINRRTGDVTRATGEIVTVWADEKKPEPRFEQLIAKYAADIKPRIEAVIGTAAGDITREQTPAGESALGNLIADAQRWKAGTQMAFMNPGGIRADIQQGPVTWGRLYEIQPFGNNLVTMKMTGEQIYTLLNQQWQKQGDQIRTRFLQISGLKYSWDDRRPFGDKVVEIWLENDEPIDKAATYTVVANSFLAAGGDNFIVFKEAKDQETGPIDLDALVDYIKTLPQRFKCELSDRVIRLDKQ